MKGVVIVAVGALAFAGATAARTLVNEDFEGAKFPPKNWEKYIHREAGDWIRKSAGANHYARGWVRLIERQGRWVSLYTNSFYVRAGRQITITLRYSGWTTGAVWNDIIEIYLRGGLHRTYYKELPYSKNWQRLKWVLPELERGRDYRFEFHAAGIAPTGTKPTIYFNVDDVRATCCPPAVDPTSLGRVKALFR